MVSKENGVIRPLTELQLFARGCALRPRGFQLRRATARREAGASSASSDSVIRTQRKSRGRQFRFGDKSADAGAPEIGQIRGEYAVGRLSSHAHRATGVAPALRVPSQRGVLPYWKGTLL